MTSSLVDFKKEHQAILKDYLNFFAKKRDECFHQVKLAIEDVSYENRNTQLFTKVDFDEMMSKMQTDLEETVKSEL